MSSAIVLLPRDYDEQVAEQIQVITEYEDTRIDTTSQIYEKLFSQLGSWFAWTEHIAKGKDYLSQKPIYSRYYCVTEHLGRANADILRKALEESKDCQYFDGKELFSIVGIHQVSDDWSSGWKINYI